MLLNFYFEEKEQQSDVNQLQQHHVLPLTAAAEAEAVFIKQHRRETTVLI